MRQPHECAVPIFNSFFITVFCVTFVSQTRWNTHYNRNKTLQCVLLVSMGLRIKTICHQVPTIGCHCFEAVCLHSRATFSLRCLSKCCCHGIIMVQFLVLLNKEWYVQVERDRTSDVYNVYTHLCAISVAFVFVLHCCCKVLSFSYVHQPLFSSSFVRAWHVLR